MEKIKLISKEEYAVLRHIFTDFDDFILIGLPIDMKEVLKNLEQEEFFKNFLSQNIVNRFVEIIKKFKTDNTELSREEKFESVLALINNYLPHSSNISVDSTSYNELISEFINTSFFSDMLSEFNLRYKLMLSERRLTEKEEEANSEYEEFLEFLISNDYIIQLPTLEIYLEKLSKIY